MEEVKQRHFQEDEMIEIILNLCRDIYPYFKNRGIEYVVAHEFTHFLQPNHSKKF